MNLKVVFNFRSLLAATLLAAACVPARVLPIAGPDDLSRGVRRFPDLTTEELAAGRALFASRCGSCHQPPAPTSRPPIEWPGEIQEMRERARLSEKDMQLIERYVVTMSEAPPRSAAGTVPTSKQ